MYLTNHAAAGVLISQHIDHPLSVFGWAFLSHFVLDFIPHGDEGVGRWMHGNTKRTALVGGLDLVLLVLMVMILYSSDKLGLNREMALIGIIGGVMPDLLSHAFPMMHEKLNWFFLVRWLKNSLDALKVSPLYRFLNRRQDRLHFFIHNLPERNLSWTQGLVFQALVLAVFIFIGYRFR